MADNTPPSPPAEPPRTGGVRTLADLDGDVLAHCAGYLGVRDVASLAMACAPLRAAAYSDSVWARLFREQWPHQRVPAGATGLRDLYIRRHIAIQQMKFDDPFMVVYSPYATGPASSPVLLDKNDIWFAQGSMARRLRLSSANSGSIETLRAHGSRITCMRLFPTSDTSLFKGDMKKNENVLVTSSTDRTIRLWWKGRSQRCFKGHSGPVTALADRLLGDGASKVLASGGEDCTVRLWSVSSSGKNHSLTLTYHGHEKALSFLSVARHKPSLLVSISKDSKVRVWDAAASSSSGSSSCVGSTILGGSPIAMKCYDSLCYVATQSQVTAIDLRTMKKAFSTAVHNHKIYSFEMLLSKWLMCTGVEDKALLWDVRKPQELPKTIAELNANGPVTLLHMDPYKVATGGPSDYVVNVWETGTDILVNSLNCHKFDEAGKVNGVLGMAVDGCRIVTVCSTEEGGDLYYRDFSNCSVPVSSCSSPVSEPVSKFWGPQDLDED